MSKLFVMSKMTDTDVFLPAEYAWFVDTKNDIAMYWKDNNRSETGTGNHPVGAWTQGQLHSVPSVPPSNKADSSQ